MHDTLLHREALLIVTARDLEDVALKLVADGGAVNFGLWVGMSVRLGLQSRLNH